MPHGIDVRQCIVHMYHFEPGEKRHRNLGLAFNVISVYNISVLFEDNLHCCGVPKCAA